MADRGGRELTWSRDPQRHLIRAVTQVHRDEIFGDLFGRLAGRAGTAGAGLTVDEAEAHNEVGR